MPEWKIEEKGENTKNGHDIPENYNEQYEQSWFEKSPSRLHVYFTNLDKNMILIVMFEVWN